jgi:hypothetical protein
VTSPDARREADQASANGVDNDEMAAALQRRQRAQNNLRERDEQVRAVLTSELQRVRDQLAEERRQHALQLAEIRMAGRHQVQQIRAAADLEAARLSAATAPNVTQPPQSSDDVTGGASSER